MSASRHDISPAASIGRAAARNGLLFGALLVVLAWAPVPIASNRDWSAALLAAAVLSISGGWLAGCAWRPFFTPNAVRVARAPLLLLVLWCAFALLQLIPLPDAAATLLGAEMQSLYATPPGSTGHHAAYLSLDRGATLAGSIRQCALVAVFATVLAVVSSAGRLFVLMCVLVAVGFAQAMYGLVVLFAGSEIGLWSPGQAGGVVSGTYVNQNHFAGLMEVTIPVALGLLMSGRSHEPVIASARDLVRYTTDLVLGQRGVLLFCILIMSAALIMTTSRGGIGSLAAGITAATLMSVWKNGVRARELKVGLTAVVLAVVAVLWLGAGQFSQKLQSEGLSSNRAEQRQVSYRIIAASPLAGTGIGSYRWVFPGYKDERFGAYFYEHAHNDYLEVLAEQGIVGFFLLGAGIVLIMLRITRAYASRRDRLARGALFASITGCVSLLVHGLVDFNLQIPANATYFFVLLGIGVVASTIGRGPENLLVGPLRGGAH